MTECIHNVWETAPLNPDPVSDLGYEYDPLTIIDVEECGEQFILLPGEEDHLTDEEFIIATARSICDLDQYR